MVRLVPVADEDGVVAGGIGKGDRNARAAEDSDAAETASGLVEGEGREIVKAADLILDLENVREVLPGRDWARCSINTVFVRVPSLLDSVPEF